MKQTFPVIRELREAEETSGWIKSSIALLPVTGSLVIVSRLNKEKFIKHYSYAPKPEQLTVDERNDLLKRAESKFEQETKNFAEVNKKVIGLSQSNIASILDVTKDSANGDDIVIREYFSGSSLYDITEGMTVEAMIPLFLGMIAAVEFIHHHRLLHLNLKPKKVRVTEDATGYTVKLADFGYAADEKSDPEAIHGVLAFGAPEVLRRQKEKFNETSDIFSIGAIMYYCMTRTLPFPQREGAKDFGRLLEILKSEHPPMKPTEANPAILDTPLTTDIQHKKDPEKIKQFEEVVMSILTARKPKSADEPPDVRKIESAGELHGLLMDIFPDTKIGQAVSSATITSGI